jgi:uncharacterized protein (TIGR02679 family)
VTLLRHLHHQGATLHYHGDFDWGGLRIASSLLRRVPWHPWRFTAADYRAAAPGTGTPLIGTPAESPGTLNWPCPSPHSACASRRRRCWTS